MEIENTFYSTETAFFSAIYEQYKNGNITEFKKRLESMKGKDILNFIKWLQIEGLKL